MSLALTLAACLIGQEPIRALQTDETITVEIRADDPILEGYGPSRTFSYSAAFEGTLNVWACSALDLRLRVENVAGEELAQDDDSGGGNTPYVRLDLESGQVIRVIVAASEPRATSVLELHMVAEPESADTRAAARGIKVKIEKARSLELDRDHEGARRLYISALDGLASMGGAECSEQLVAVIWDVARGADSLGDSSTAHEAWLRLRRHYERTSPPDHPFRIGVLGNLALSKSALGDVSGAKALQEDVLSLLERTHSEDDLELRNARHNLAVTLHDLGDLHGARALKQVVLESCERTLAEDDPLLLSSRVNLAVTLKELGDFEGARALEESVLEVRERLLPEGHPDLLLVRGNLATTMYSMGDLLGAHAQFRSVLEAGERALPEDHPYILDSRMNLAVTLKDLGDYRGARALEEAALDGYERTLPEGHPYLARVTLNIGSTMRAMGDLSGARSRYESVHAEFERTLPAAHPALLSAKANLALLMNEMGDVLGARALLAVVLEARRSALPEDHPDLLATYVHLAATFYGTGDLQRALELLETVLDVRERTLPAHHPQTLVARGNLAATMAKLGDLPGARALQESTLAELKLHLPANSSLLLAYRSSLARTMFEMGDYAAAREMQEGVLSARERIRPADHPDVLGSRRDLAITLWATGNLHGAREQFLALKVGMLERLRGTLTLSPREASAMAGDDWNVLSLVLSFGLFDAADDQARATDVTLVESLRHVATAPARPLYSWNLDPDLAGLAHESALVRTRLNDLVARGPTEDATTDEFANEVARLSFDRDRAERRIRAQLSERGVLMETIQALELSKALAQNSAAVGFLRYRSSRWDSEKNLWMNADSLLAHVIGSDGSFTRVELGTSDGLEELVRKWRDAVGQPIQGETDRGAGGVVGKKEAESAAVGEELRLQILDPVLEAAGGADLASLHVCVDDFLHLVPLDALPLAEGHVGDRIRIVNEVSFARLLARSAAPESEPVLVGMGGIAFDSPITRHEGPMTIAAPTGTDHRSGTATAFTPLENTAIEIRAVAEVFSEAVGGKIVLLSGADASKQALHQLAPSAQVLHLATHGWFAQEGVASMDDARFDHDDSWSGMTAKESITGFAPLTLCGLALAGANGPRDPLGRVPGILTAEELAGIDLSRCDLSVLSACETNVGVHRAGQAIRSLQTALYAAGARSSITSLWKVPDEATRELMVDFYRRLWIEKSPKWQALWEAKMALRAKGHPTRDWAGWVLTGDPD